ncbi:hemopexin [Pimephales promelas]|uniref:hemopexin n=1 Tax=Pimephales promelas TaxID=90988 RepID=UPI001955C2A7|nr:hemopexin [Pimephales promelas]
MTAVCLFLCVSLALALSNAAPAHHDVMMKDAPELHDAKPDRCTGIEFDAITPDEKGNTFFFKGDHLWKGFSGPAELSSSFFKELDDHHDLGHVDAAFRMHHQDDASVHDHVYFFLDDKVFSFYNYTLEKGYPVEIQHEFPGVPSHLDAAVECPEGECITDSVLFFKGNETYSYDIKTKTVKKKMWTHLPTCTSAFRWLEHYYCFHGNNFTRFHPVSGEVTGTYPKDARHYFMRCGAGFGHGGDARSLRCSDVKLHAITTDDKGRTYAFHDAVYLRLDSHRDGIHRFPISRSWKEISGGVDAVFSYGDTMYIIQSDQVYIYKSAAHYTLIEGYPKPLKEELGIDGPVDAAFLCPKQDTVFFIQGQNMRAVDLAATPRVVKKETPIPFPKIDAGFCDADGVKVFIGPEYYSYESPMILAMSRIRPQPQKISPEKFGCED